MGSEEVSLYLFCRCRRKTVHDRFCWGNRVVRSML